MRNEAAIFFLWFIILCWCLGKKNKKESGRELLFNGFEGCTVVDYSETENQMFVFVLLRRGFG